MTSAPVGGSAASSAPTTPSARPPADQPTRLQWPVLASDLPAPTGLLGAPRRAIDLAVLPTDVLDDLMRPSAFFLLDDHLHAASCRRAARSGAEVMSSLANALKERSMVCCEHLGSSPARLLWSLRELTAAASLEFLADDAALDVVNRINWALERVPLLAPLAAQAYAGVERARAASVAWCASDAALELLDLRASVRSLPWARQVLTSVFEPPGGSGGERERERANALPLNNALLCALLHPESLADAFGLHHLERPRPAGYVLVTAPAQVAHQLTTDPHLVYALSRFEVGLNSLRLPRSLEPLARRPSARRDYDVHVSVLRESDDDAVLETALVLLDDGLPTPASALRAARALV